MQKRDQSGTRRRFLRSDAKSPNAPRKLVCLETYWHERLFESFSVRPFLEVAGTLLNPPLRVAHRFVESEAGLVYYAKRGGVMWRQAELFDAPVFYLAFHGKPGTVISLTGDIGAQPLIEAFEGYGAGYDNLVYFAACSMLRGAQGERFAREFVKKTGVRAVIGYTTRVDWMASLVADLIFLHRFYRDPSPWRNLRRIFASVSRDYPLARRLGHTLIVNGNAASRNR